MHNLDLIHAAAADHPDRVAVVFNNKPLSFSAFYRSILSTRRFLETHRPRAGAIAVIWNDNILESWCLDFALRSLGLLTASVQTAPEVAHFADSDAACVVTTYAQAAASNLDVTTLPLAAPVICVPAEAFAPGDLDAPLPPPPQGPTDLGHLLLTSATTGVYKKVWLRPTISVEQIEAGIEEYRRRQVDVGKDGERVLSLVNLGLWTASGYGPAISMWITGNAVSIFQHPDLWRAFDYPGLTHAMVTPGFLYDLMRLPPERPTSHPNLTLLVVGGAMSMKLAREVRERVTPRLVSTLGSTEGGMWAITPLQTDEDLRFHKINPTRELQVVDEDDQPLPAGHLGRLRVRIEADGAQSYYDDEEATAACFRDGWFYPGDLAIARDDGRISLHGRVTDIISIEGYKVAAEPIERALQERLNVDSACVFSMWGTEAEELHVVLQTNRPIPPEALAEAIQASLRGFPRAHVHFVEDIPRNHMGKIRRLALKQMLMERDGVKVPAGAPATTPDVARPPASSSSGVSPEDP